MSTQGFAVARNSRPGWALVLLLVLGALLGGYLLGRQPRQRTLSEAEEAQVSALREEADQYAASIAETEATLSTAARLLGQISSIRLETERSILAMLEQRILAIETGARISETVEIEPVDEERVHEIQQEIDAENIELRVSRAGAETAGGLVRTLKLTNVATSELSIAMLRMRLLSAKYGLSGVAAGSDATSTPALIAGEPQQVAQAAAPPTVAADSCNTKRVFGRYCLGANISTLKGQDAIKDGKYVWTERNEIVDTVAGRVAVVSRYHKTTTLPRFLEINAELEELYGLGDDSETRVPAFAKGDAAQTAISVEIGMARLSVKWDQGDWTIILGWTEDGFGLIYTLKELAELAKNPSLGDMGEL